MSTADPKPRPILDRCAIVVFLGLFAVATLRQGLALDRAPWSDATSPPAAFAVVAGLSAVAGYVVADLLAGLTHWIADRFFAENTPWIGPLLIEPFRAHHVDPGSIARHDFATVSGNAALTTTPVALALFLLPPPDDLVRLGAFVFATVLTLSLFLTNTFHRWAHARERSAIVRALHRTGLVLTPARHARHHAGAHDRAYCVTSGWLNPVLDGLRVFPRLERVVRSIGAPER